jgi:hypothetical protein
MVLLETPRSAEPEGDEIQSLSVAHSAVSRLTTGKYVE